MDGESQTPESPIIAPTRPVRSVRGARSTGTRPAHLAGPPVRRILVDRPPVPAEEPETDVEDDGELIDIRPVPSPVSPPRIAVAPSASQGQRRRLPWEVRPYGSQAATPGRRRSRDEMEDEDDEDQVAPWEPKRRDVKINVNQSVTWYDPIMLDEETVNIKDYLAKSPSNIVIAHGPKLSEYFFTNRQSIAKQKNAATMFPCKEIGTLRPSNIVRSGPVYDFRAVGLIISSFCDISALAAKPNHQLFAIVDTGKTYPSFVAENVLDRGGSHVSAVRCQAGYERPVTMLVAASPVETALGGRRRSKRSRVTRRKKRAGKAKTMARCHKQHTKKCAKSKMQRHNRKTKKRNA